MGKRGPKLTRLERALKRDRIVELALRHYSQTEIARREGVTQQYVSYVLKVEERWHRMRARKGAAVLRQRQVARAEMRERAAMDAWEASRGVREIRESEQSGEGGK